VAIDAIPFFGQTVGDQLEQEFLLRDLNKAFVGFMGIQALNESLLLEFENLGTKSDRKAIVTGKWGCGAFNGNPEIKFIIQWIASSINQRDMIFTSFMD
jgi:poly(ADP-ribose) glycohydrolase